MGAIHLGAERQGVHVQTNSAGDTVTLIDPATDRVAAEIRDEEVVHGAAAAPDGSRLYLSMESTDTVDVIDARTLKLVKKIAEVEEDVLVFV